MVGLIECNSVYAATPLQRLFSRRRKNKDITVRLEKYFNIFVLRIVINAAENEKRKNFENKLEQVYTVLNSQKIRKLCFKSDFLDKSFFLNRGFNEIDDMRLYEEKTMEIMCSAIKGRNKNIFIYSDIVDRKTINFAYDACRQFRYIMLDIGDASRKIGRDMQKKFGVSIVANPSSGQILKADGAVLFGDAEKGIQLREDCVAVFPREKPKNFIKYSRYVAGVEFEVCGANEKSQIPAGYRGSCILTEALECGKIKAEDIKIKNVEIEEKSRNRE